MWEREIRRWLDNEPVQIIDGSTAKAREKQLHCIISDGGWAIVNYEQVRAHQVKKTLRNGGKKAVWEMKQPLFEDTPWLAVIADEAHRAKNRKALGTRGLYRIQASLMLALTGTPLMNSPDELWSLLHWLFPKEYSSYWRFDAMYVEYHEGFFGRVVTGVKNPDSLRFTLSDKLVRRTKGEVLDLPDKVRVTVPVMLGDKQRKLYEEAEKSLWLEVAKAAEEGDESAKKLGMAAAAGEPASTLYRIQNGASRTVRLRQVASSPALLGGEDDSAKLDACVDQITDNAHKPHVVFTEFKGTVALLGERLRKKGLTVAVYTGDVQDHERTELEDSFQRGEIDVLVGTWAMSEGVTLTAADTVHFLERNWNPARNTQAEDRLHRIGQDSHVTVLIYEAVNTVDDGNVRPTNKLKESMSASVLPTDYVEEREVA